MYGDFDADCSLVIKDPDKFLDRLIEAFRKELPEYEPFVDDCNYFDPLNPEVKKLDVYFSKHFRFAYQKEIRVIWLPPKPETKLDPIYLELGDLRDCCEIIRLTE